MNMKPYSQKQIDAGTAGADSAIAAIRQTLQLPAEDLELDAALLFAAELLLCHRASVCPYSETATVQTFGFMKDCP